MPRLAEENATSQPLFSGPTRSRLDPHVVEKHLVQVVHPVDRDDRRTVIPGVCMSMRRRDALLALGGLRVGAPDKSTSRMRCAVEVRFCR
jgi:hypothetical protein